MNTQITVTNEQLESARDIERNRLNRAALIEELLKAVLELRKAWIAPQRYSESKASLNVARLSDEIQQLD